jgi:dynein assembly factor 5, axonemal
VDPAEKYRDLGLTYVSMYATQYCANDNHLEQILVLLLPRLVQRLGMNDIVEPSEEIRLKSVSLLFELSRGHRLSLYLNEWISILKRTLVDPYPEVRKVSW